jgi:oligopeptide/dipeptide ABC transporter ATP-binding protein
VGDQIAESIVLHRRRWLARKIVLRMRLETARRRVLAALREAFRDPKSVPLGVDLANPTHADLRFFLDILSKKPPANAALIHGLRELIAYEAVLGSEMPKTSIYARGLPRGQQLAMYEKESLRASWKANDVLAEMESLASVLRGLGDVVIPWRVAESVGPFAVAIEPAAGLTPEAAAAAFVALVNQSEGAAAGWSVLGRVLGPPRVEPGRFVVEVQEGFRRARPGLTREWSPTTRLSLGEWWRERLFHPHPGDWGRWIGLRIPGLGRSMTHAIRRQSVDEAAEVLRLLRIPDPERIVTMYPHELSGGMNQRAMIAIALACDPMLLIADEPTTALDVTIQAQILELLRELKSKGRPSILLITHDLGVIAEMCDKVCVMYGGHVVEEATVKEIFKNPLHPYTKGLLRAIPSHAVRKDRLEVIKGSVPNLIYPPSGCRFHPRCPAAMPHCGWDAKDLEPAIRTYVEELGVDSKLITTVPGDDLFALRFSFAEEGGAREAMGEIVARVSGDRGSSVLLQAVTEIRSEGSDLIFSMVRSKKPRDQQVQPDHMVACYLFERPVDVKPLAIVSTAARAAPLEAAKPVEVA